MESIDGITAAGTWREEYRAAVVEYLRLHNDPTAAAPDRGLAALRVMIVVGKYGADELGALLKELQPAGS